MRLWGLGVLPELPEGTLNTALSTPFSTAQELADYTRATAYSWNLDASGVNGYSFGSAGNTTFETTGIILDVYGNATENGIVYETHASVANFSNQKHVIIGMNPYYYQVVDAYNYDRFYDNYPVNRKTGIIGNSMPGTWRPFSLNSPYNLPIPHNVRLFDSANIQGVYPKFSTTYPNSNNLVDYFVRIESDRLINHTINKCLQKKRH